MLCVTKNDLINSGIQVLINAKSSTSIVQLFSSINACEQYLKHHGITVLLIDDAYLKACSPPRQLQVYVRFTQ